MNKSCIQLMYFVMSIIHPKAEIIPRSVMKESYQKITLPACWSWVLPAQLICFACYSSELCATSVQTTAAARLTKTKTV